MEAEEANRMAVQRIDLLELVEVEHAVVVVEDEDDCQLELA